MNRRMAQIFALVITAFAMTFFLPGGAAQQPAVPPAGVAPAAGDSLTYHPHFPPSDYNPPPVYDEIVSEEDLTVRMRDGVRLSINVYRPVGAGPLPALLSFAYHNKDLGGPALAGSIPPQPAWQSQWGGPVEAGDTEYLVSRGYVHVLGNPRGVGKSEDGPPSDWDYYDLIEWIAEQPWCDGNVGMMGLSAFAGAQFQAAQQQPPALKAIFPQDSGPMYPFVDQVPGGLVHVFPALLAPDGVFHHVQNQPGVLAPEMEERWQAAMNNPDYKIYPRMWNILTQKGQLSPVMFSFLVNPYAPEDVVERGLAMAERINIPTYTGSGWYAYTYKYHLQGSQSWYEHLDVPKKLMFTGVPHLDRPFHAFHNEALRWYDYWLKGIDTGIMDEPPVKFWVAGANRWVSADDWPVPETQWTRLYLESWERLRSRPFTPSTRSDFDEPDAFVQMPISHTNTVQRLRYMTDPLPEDTMVAGPISLTLYASIDQEDTNWIVILKDVGPDVSVRSARDGERELPSDLPERELTRGWLKASHRALNAELSKPWKPFHPLTRSAQRPVVPGEIVEYQIEISSTANVFRRGHRIVLEITSIDLPTGVGGQTNVVYIPFHITSSKTTLHKVYHNEQYPSNLLLPVIPASAQRWIP